MKQGKGTLALALALAAVVCWAPRSWAGTVSVNGSGLQDTLDSSTSCSSNQCLDAGGGTISPQWVIIGDPTSQSTILAEIAGYAGQNAFGIYDPYNPPTASELTGTSGSNYLQLFSGPDSTGDSATLSYDPTTGVYEVTGTNGTASTTFSSGDVFGFYLYGPGGLFFSNPSLNEPSPTFPGGVPHMLGFQGGPGITLTLNNQPFTANDYIMAWEDLPYPQSDFDYNDFIVELTNVRPVPEPAGIAIFALGLLAIAGLAVRRRRTAVSRKD